MSKVIDAIIGHAIGDAMGVPTEFKSRNDLTNHPITDMIGYGSHSVPAGTWSDDTSMEIALIDSYNRNDSFNYEDIMLSFSNWVNKREYTATNKVFDIGRTCLTAINNYNKGINPIECGLIEENSNGNGSLMRILPIALYSYYNNLSEDNIIKLTNDISSLTHRHDISKLGCYIYVRYIIYLLKGLSKEEAYENIKKIDYSTYSKEAIFKYNRILKNNIKDYNIEDIESSGYIVSTLECALYILLNTNTYKDAIIMSTNIGNDTDTIGAILGSMAGIIYGIDTFPIEWLNTLKRKDYLIELSNIFECKIILNNIKEEDVLFITNPGRMGDEYGSTFIVRNNNILTIYRLDDYTSDLELKFPKWKESWHNFYEDKNYIGKYTYLYMGFGNGLCVDNSIYNLYKPYLDKLLKGIDKDNHSAIFSRWENAVKNMCDDNGFMLKEE